MSEPAYMANLWEVPELTIAIFGIQVQSEEAGRMYAESGIEEELHASLAQEPGVLCMRRFVEGSGGIQLLYWRSHRELADYSKRMPHMKWWKWLVEHDGQGLSFYHEIYQCKTAEAVFTGRTEPVGPGTFCATSPMELGSNRSQQRQDRFAESQKALR